MIKDMKDYLTIPYLLSLGLTQNNAERVIEKYQEEFFFALSDKPKKAAAMLDLDSKELANARIADAKQRYATALFDYLASFKVKDAVTMRILDAHESVDAAIKAVKESPYSLCSEYGAPFKSADALALSLGEEFYSKRRISSAILEVLTNCIDLKDNRLESISGSMYVELPELQAYVSLLLGIDTENGENLPHVSFMDALHGLFATHDIHISYRKGKAPAVYSKHLAEVEFGIAKNIKERLANPPEEIKGLTALIERSEAELGILLSDEQMDAVRMAISSPISVITGGPGTGKTSVQKVLIETFEWATKCKPIRLIAPTGQAAKRMTQSTGRPATTLHKALDLLAGETEKVLDQPLDEELIIADEASMIDAELFNLLLQNVSMNTRLVIVGDINQLPSIRAGAVLRELIFAKRVPTTRLTKIFRQADDSPIAYNSARINTGEKTMIENENFQLVEAGSEDRLAEKVTEEYLKAVNEVGVDEVICLSAYRRSTSTGVNALNQTLRAALRPELTDSTPHCTINDIKYYEGDKIVFGKNKQGLVNGDLGYITEILGRRAFKAKFGDLEVTLKNEDAECIDLAYAQTVHSATCSCLKRASVA